VQFMRQRLFGQRSLAEAFDATDGVAIALCHAHQRVGSLDVGGQKNNLAEKIEALKQVRRSANRFEEKLKEAGVDAMGRQKLILPPKRNR
ncbi:MAG: hypothetical protein ACO36I_02175, partial [Candidatus Latescibacterota bacterium]